LTSYISSEKLLNYVNIIISNNHSCDNTQAIIDSYAIEFQGVVFSFNQSTNIGLERNSVFVLSKAKSRYIMYLGDDDYISPYYLKTVIELIWDDKCTAILPNFKNMNLRDKIHFEHIDSQDIIFHTSSFNSIRRYIGRGHQLSGLVFMRNGLLDSYLKNDLLRNIYLFIYFVGYSIMQGDFYTVNSAQVHVTSGNPKDWKYGRDSLVPQVFCNFSSLYPKDILKQFFLQITFLSQQRWRLLIRIIPIKAIKVSWYICKAKETTNLLRVSLPFFLLWFYISFIFRIFIRQFNRII
jgi:glycosyltransferase involved in cell wall biosynthesis